MVAELQLVRSIYARPSEIFDADQAGLLVAVAQPRPYAMLEQSELAGRRARLDNPSASTWEALTYPARGALALGSKENAVVVVPKTTGMSSFLEGLEQIRSYYGLGTPLDTIEVPMDFHEPPNGSVLLDTAMLRFAPDIAAHLQTQRPDYRSHLVVTHATTPDTLAWMDAVRAEGILLEPVSEIKKGERPSPAYRHGFSSIRPGEDPRTTFIARYGLPAAPGVVAYSETEARRAYEIVKSVSGSNEVFTKIDESGGGSYVGQDNSGDAVAQRFRDWKTDGKLVRVFEHETPIEIQAVIPGIVSIGSFQYGRDRIITPEPRYTMQVMDGNVWQGNVYNSPEITGVPPEQQEGVAELIYEMQARFMHGIAQEKKNFAGRKKIIDEGDSMGGGDFAVAQISRMQDPKQFIPQDMLEMAVALGVDYMPILIEHNGSRASDALWPALLAEQLGLLDTNLPFMTRYISPITSNLGDAWTYLRSIHAQYEHGSDGGVVPMAWVRDTKLAIYSGALLVVGKDLDDMQRRFQETKGMLKKAGYIGAEDSPENM